MITYLANVGLFSSTAVSDWVVFVNDPLQGGYFNYSPSTLPHDFGITFDAMGGGSWVRQYSTASDIFFTWFGGIGDGVSNNSTAMGYFLTACNTLSKKGYIPDGNYHFGSTIQIQNSNLVLEWSERAIFFCDTNTLLLGQSSYTSYLTNITLINLQVNSGATPSSGGIISLKCNQLTLTNLKINNYVGGNAVQLAGDNILVTNPYITTATATSGAGGIVFCGGNNFMCSNGYVVSGDDAFQFAPLPVGADANFSNLPITNSTYLNCKGFSLAGRLCVCYVNQNNTSLNQRNTFDNVTGHGAAAQNDIFIADLSISSFGARALSRNTTTTSFRTDVISGGYPYYAVGVYVVISNAVDATFNGTYMIASTTIVGTTCTYTAPNPVGVVTPGTTTGASVMLASPGVNKVTDITLNNVQIDSSASTSAQSINLQYLQDTNINNLTVISPKNMGMLIQNCIRLRANNTKLDTSQATGHSLLEIENSTDIYWNNGVLIGNKTDTIALVGGGTLKVCSNVRFSNTLFYNIPDMTTYGLDFNFANDCSAINCSFQNHSTLVSGTGIHIGSAAQRCEILSNDLYNTGGAYLPIVNASTTTTLFGNGSATSGLLPPGTATTAPLIFTTGTNLTAFTPGAMEYDGTHLYITTASSGPRYQLDHNINQVIMIVTSSIIASNALNTDYIYIVTATATITLPNAAGNTNFYTIKNAGTGTVTVTISPIMSQTIFIASAIPGNQILSPGSGASLRLVSDNSNWFAV